MQRRKNAAADPYINHPLRVAAVLVECGVTDEMVLVGAVLHDTLEDTATTRDELRSHFGEEIAALVSEVTDDKSLPKAERKRQQILHASSASIKAKLIKLADKLDNLTGLVDDAPQSWPPERIQGYACWSLEVVNNCRGVNKDLENRLNAVFAAEFSLAGKKHALVPRFQSPADASHFLSEYLKQMEEAGKTEG